ncbi:30S ribosomal protein S8e [Desulfurococcus amylolyticus 1221n]|uniref:Small ribosomal subunit protein eS8 n=1 Tax=Desulfurococcus amylolyticus (strain DSM 18924 / JCM 16383 / VKM B-2413 / 1221n) TaxID=490899 RepID=B8D571_DESA1|nr:30S ribosomal protein S8e [Desulfurococcus amylolyticus]ACL11252.1 30S ribosomal protein S8e [Desulfurococcus amylolyticus 1221n]
MSHYQGNDLRKPTGGLKGEKRGKRKYELGSPPVNTTLSSSEEKIHVRTFGGGVKYKLKKALYINIAVPDDKTVKKVKILDVVETPSNPQNARFKIISKGTIVKTELGLVKVTSRPGQDGVLNGILLKK